MDEKEKKREQWAFGILGLFILVSLWTFSVSEYYLYLIAYLWFGFVYGMALQYGRFCFASAFRDLFAVGVPRMVVGIMIATILFAFVASFLTATGLSNFHPAPTSVHSAIAGLIFGIGMVFAGGCASGSLYKSGEGNGPAMIVIFSISVTQVIFVDIGGVFNKFIPAAWAESALEKGLPASLTVSDGWMDQYLTGYVWNQPVTTFAEMLGMENASFAGAIVGDFFVGVVVPAMFLLVLVYFFWARTGFRKKIIKQKGAMTFKDEVAGFWTMVMASKRTAIAGLVLGVACGMQMLVMAGLRIKFGINNAGEILQKIGWDSGLSEKGTIFDPGYWYVTTQEAQWVAWVVHKLGFNTMDNVFFGFVNGIPNPLVNPAGWMSIAVVGGAAVMALLNNEFKWKMPTVELALWAALGGFFMGVGARLALGCNVGAFFVRVANGDPSGWLFGGGMFAGAYIGVKIFNVYTERKMAKEMEACGF